MSKKKKLSILCTIYNRCEKRTENWEVSIPEKVLECLKLSLMKFRAMESLKYHKWYNKGPNYNFKRS